MGRIGRLCFRVLWERGLSVAAINDPHPKETIAHLLRYDSTHGQWARNIQQAPRGLLVEGQEVRVGQAREIVEPFWKEAEVEIVIECSGALTTSERASVHLRQGAKRVIISAPAKSPEIPTVVLGVNDDTITGREEIISNASCTTNCLAIMAKVLDDHFGLREGFISTVHAYTSDQRLVDRGHRDLRRARAAAQSIVPTTTGAAKGIGRVLPQLKGRLDGLSMRVPVQDGSLTDLVCLVDEEVTPEAVNAAFKKAAAGPLQRLLSYVEDPIVSADVIGAPQSCLFDALLTQTRGQMVKAVGWYDNEMGYTHRIADLTERIIQLNPKF